MRGRKDSEASKEHVSLQREREKRSGRIWKEEKGKEERGMRRERCKL